MRTRIFRALVCLVLVAALLVQVSPIRVEATDNSPNFFYIDPELQLASDLIGLGVSTGADSLAHTQVIQDAADWLAETGDWLSEGMLKVYKVAAAAGGFKYMVDADFLQELLEWMFDVEVVKSSGSGNCATTSLTVSAKKLSGYDYPVTFKSSEPFSLIRFHHTDYANRRYFCRALVAENPCVIYAYKSSGELVGTHEADTAIEGYYFTNGTAFQSSDYTGDEGIYLGEVFQASYEEWDSVGIKNCFFYAARYWSDSFGFNNTITTDKDLTLNHVGAFGSILPDSYPDWFTNSTTITDSETGEEKTVVPVALGQTVTETQGMSQADVWAGNSTYVDTETDVGTGDDTITVPETVTLKDILTGILSVPKSIAEAVAGFFADVVAAVKAIPAAITEFFTISTDVSAFAIEWRDFFPFCIPFDIYDFLTLLMADPEAPKFEWEIDLLKTGEPYLMVVDLSEWDDVAQLLRRLELLAFIVGLAMVTREKYIRG